MRSKIWWKQFASLGFLGLLLLMAAAPLSASTENLIINGSFESVPLASGKWTTLYGTSLTGWTAGAKGIEVRNNVSGTASDGNNFVELDTSANSSMWQTINVAAGVNYLLSFDFCQRLGVSGSDEMQVFLYDGAAPSGSAIWSTTLKTDVQKPWTTFSDYVTAASGQMTLVFAAAGGSNSYGLSLDNVKMSTVPLPPAVLLLGSGLLGLLGFRRRQAA